ncbi:jg7025 [Pararge aegeria aegeria]|uniref:Jg7025 protein n=1 Tax=Pararge aegeria aegeria TaxID=348720 RepID=A0A8S4RG75_9NEOP|nr:jg7025 [Pararge aegeria aegeria]
MTSSESLGAAGGKRPRTVYCGTPYKRPMSSSGRRLVDMMMMMIIKTVLNRNVCTILGFFDGPILAYNLLLDERGPFISGTLRPAMSLTTPFAILSMPKYNKAKITPHTCVLKLFETHMGM